MAGTRYTRSVRVTVQFQIEEEKLASLFRGTIDRASMHRAKTDVYLLPWLVLGCVILLTPDSRFYFNCFQMPSLMSFGVAPLPSTTFVVTARR